MNARFADFSDLELSAIHRSLSLAHGKAIAARLGVRYVNEGQAKLPTVYAPLRDEVQAELDTRMQAMHDLSARNAG